MSVRIPFNPEDENLTPFEDIVRQVLGQGVAAYEAYYQFLRQVIGDYESFYTNDSAGERQATQEACDAFQRNQIKATVAVTIDAERPADLSKFDKFHAHMREIGEEFTRRENAASADVRRLFESITAGKGRA